MHLRHKKPKSVIKSRKIKELQYEKKDVKIAEQFRNTNEILLG